MESTLFEVKKYLRLKPGLVSAEIFRLAKENGAEVNFRTRDECFRWYSGFLLQKKLCRKLINPGHKLKGFEASGNCFISDAAMVAGNKTAPVPGGLFHNWEIKYNHDGRLYLLLIQYNHGRWFSGYRVKLVKKRKALTGSSGIFSYAAIFILATVPFAFLMLLDYFSPAESFLSIFFSLGLLVAAYATLLAEKNRKIKYRLSRFIEESLEEYFFLENCSGENDTSNNEKAIAEKAEAEIHPEELTA